jgi:hypothetical protein
MKLFCLALICTPALFPSVCHASERAATAIASSTPSASTERGESSSRSLPEGPDAAPVTRAATLGHAAAAAGGQDVYRRRPLSTVGLSVKAGSTGVGFDVATSLLGRLNLRAGASFFNYSHHFNEDGIPADGTINLKSANASLDFFPFGNAFRVSPGVMFYNDNHVSAVANVPGGQSFTLNDVSYTSSPIDPVHGTFGVVLGRKAAPSLTLGFGNIVPRGRKHWSIPVEVGAAFVGDPTVTLNLTGSACSTDGCGSVTTDATTQANIQKEQATLKNDISPLRFYPIASVGFSYKF